MAGKESPLIMNIRKLEPIVRAEHTSNKIILFNFRFITGKGKRVEHIRTLQHAKENNEDYRVHFHAPTTGVSVFPLVREILPETQTDILRLFYQTNGDVVDMVIGLTQQEVVQITPEYEAFHTNRY